MVVRSAVLGRVFTVPPTQIVLILGGKARLIAASLRGLRLPFGLGQIRAPHEPSISGASPPHFGSPSLVGLCLLNPSGEVTFEVRLAVKSETKFRVLSFSTGRRKLRIRFDEEFQKDVQMARAVAVACQVTV